MKVNKFFLFIVVVMTIGAVLILMRVGPFAPGFGAIEQQTEAQKLCEQIRAAPMPPEGDGGMRVQCFYILHPELRR